MIDRRRGKRRGILWRRIGPSSEWWYLFVLGIVLTVVGALAYLVNG